MSINEKKDCNAGDLVENPFHIIDQAPRKWLQVHISKDTSRLEDIINTMWLKVIGKK